MASELLGEVAATSDAVALGSRDDGPKGQTVMGRSAVVLERRSRSIKELVGCLVVIASLGGCGREIAITSHYRATISVDGIDYTSETVVHDYKLTWGPSKAGHVGIVLTFRLPDDRVVVLGTFTWQSRLKCVPRINGASDCPERWRDGRMAREPDGFIFDSATNPTKVEAFQFEPVSEYFERAGPFGIKPATDLRIRLVDYHVRTVKGAGEKPRDTLKRDFPGYPLTRNDRLSAVNWAADRLRIPLQRDRRD